LEYGEWVNCVVLGDDSEVTLLRHYRYGANKTVLELVSGMADNGEDPLVAMRRELEEEIGLKNATITKTGVMYANPATHTNKVHCFLAQGGSFDGLKEHETGADFDIIKMPLSKLQDIINDQSEVMQGFHLASLFMALNFLKK
jgi:8-oxo-dGTP pyrophosphatase MutT (NUDIX family)